jgi:hypothetical protein
MAACCAALLPQVPDSMLLQPQAPYTSGRRARSAQQQQQQEGAAGAEGDVQQQQQQQQQKVVKKRRARVMTPSGMGMCQDISPGSIKAVPVVRHTDLPLHTPLWPHLSGVHYIVSYRSNM